MKKGMLLVILASMIGDVQANDTIHRPCVCEKSFISVCITTPVNEIYSVSHSVEAYVAGSILMDEVYSVEVCVGIATFQSDNKRLDKEAQEVLEVDCFPEVTFESLFLSVLHDTIVATGIISLHGMEKIITVNVNHQRQGIHSVFTGNFKIPLSEFDVNLPWLSRNFVHDEVEIYFELNF